MVVLPPGTILQLMYLRKRLQRLPPGRFVEVGPGSGEITRLLLDLGWTGGSYDLEEATIAFLNTRFAKEIAEHRFTPFNADYLSSTTPPEKVDLVISCMVMEHLDEDMQSSFMERAAANLRETGLMIGLVPASPEHWGIEDEVAGHCRRYTRKSIRTLAEICNWRLEHVAGLTFPISNFLLPVSNYLVNRSERSLLTLSPLERTKRSGKREVKFKTHFPSILGMLLNEYTLFPFYIVQTLFSNSKCALVLYFEASPPNLDRRIHKIDPGVHTLVAAPQCD